MRIKYGLVFSLVVLGATVGCGKGDGAKLAGSSVGDEHRHESWWCDEHGLPEENCTKCNPKLVAGFKAKGDWCNEHDCPETQCFICHPEKKAEFAALYEAKYGKHPPGNRRRPKVELQCQR